HTLAVTCHAPPGAICLIADSSRRPRPRTPCVLQGLGMEHGLHSSHRMRYRWSCLLLPCVLLTGCARSVDEWPPDSEVDSELVNVAVSFTSPKNDATVNGQVTLQV